LVRVPAQKNNVISSRHGYHGHLDRAGLPVRLEDVAGGWTDADALLDLMSRDKKVKRGKLNLILLRDIGHAYIAPDIGPAPLRAFLVEKLKPR
jgi:3-dehydroquinate synthase